MDSGIKKKNLEIMEPFVYSWALENLPHGILVPLYRELLGLLNWELGTSPTVKLEAVW
jgi:hypothetical protein